MKNKKGFTLVELLAVIVILGVITGISIPLIRNLQGTMSDKKFNAYLTSLKTGAKLYNDSYADDLFGHNRTGVACVSYKELEEKNLLKDIGIDDISCNHDNTYVRIIKLDDRYTYTPYLTCGKKENGKATTIEKEIPDPKDPSYQVDLFCGKEGSTSTLETIKINATDSYQSSVFDKKRRKTSIEIVSLTGIYNKISISVAWTKENTYTGITNWEKLDFKVEGNQKEKLLNGESIITTSKELVTPQNGDGAYYLFVKVDNLQDIYGNKWTSSNSIDGKYLKLGPFAVDNTAPTIENLKVESTTSNYNSLNTNIKFTGKDNHSSASELKMCISESNDECTSFVKYSDSTSHSFKGTYNGSEKTIYVTLKDKAGNIKKTSVKYKVAISRTITYNVNGGKGCSPTSKTIYHNQGVLRTWETLCTPTRIGYKFKGWNTNKNGTGTTITSVSKATSSITVYAQWEINKVYIKINTNGGSLVTPHGGNISSNGSYITLNNSETIHTITYGGKLTTDGIVDWNNSNYINIKRTGYDAVSGAEWTNGSGTNYSQSKVYYASDFCDASSKDCTVTLYVNWKQATYKLTYNPTGGSVSPTSKTIKYNDLYGSLPTPTKSGYTFAGWYDTSSYNNKITATTVYKNTTSTTIYAKWSPKTYTITFNPKGGKVSPQTKTVVFGNYYGSLPTPTKTNYTFAGWYNGNSKVTTYSIYTTIGNVTLTASWNLKKYSLNYNDNGGSGCYTTSKIVDYNSTWGTLCTPSREGYDFTGWMYNGTQITSSSKATANITVTANWSIKTYTLNYNNNGGYSCYGSERRTYGDRWVALCEPHKDNYDFVRWFDPTDNSTIDGSTVVRKNVTAVAEWKRKKLTIHYDDNGGYGCSGQTKQVEYGSDIGDLCIPSKTNFRFKSWKYNGSRVYEYTTVTKNMTLVAEWELLYNMCPWRYHNAYECPSEFTYYVDSSCTEYCKKEYKGYNESIYRNECNNKYYQGNFYNKRFETKGIDTYLCSFQFR